MTTIEQYTCYNCSGINMTSFVFPGFVNQIGNYAFNLGSRCTRDITLTIEDGVNIIGNNAFAGSRISNAELIIPASVDSIGNNAFMSNKIKKAIIRTTATVPSNAFSSNTGE